MIQIAVMGYGTVGSGVVEVLNTNQASIDKRVGEEVRVKYVLDLRDFPGDPVESVLVHDFETIVNDPEVKVVVEVMGGVEPAYTFTKRCLLAGKSVCTSNKALVAAHGAELLQIAKDKNLNYLFEASVGGGIPIIRPLQTCLTADEIVEISGILNGTTNYILTNMTYGGANFDDALKDAQEKGYAERNPEADVEGHDACRKIAILTSLVSGQRVDFEDIYTEGITKVTAEDIKYADKLGRVIKLLAMSKKEADGKYYAMVAPFLIDAANPLYNVNGVFNVIFVEGNMLGDSMFYGSGAGKLPTASAVAADVVDACKNLNENLGFYWSDEKLVLGDTKDDKRRFLVRVKGDAQADAAAMKALFGPVDLVDAGVEGEFGFVTVSLSEAEYAERAAKTDAILNRIRVEG
ncbi:homoserine dehydrogenase [Laedolimicola ammoniilytica]|uniref:Homoserine dehydrogenase n=1 Tax=Laedolimicola ammoniilytica TaxID=2981771 RepID=A0ABT2RTR1_9FIRM|nr:homoserine dehydrogenase [Laedolimicola ammoniilytica]MCU6695698.1 homoserine dehydrogenase [Laedolimicola ammoniilytica]SCH15344.1 Homoserine dehydrogenase [uncultured Clostridium sp.]